MDTICLKGVAKYVDINKPFRYPFAKGGKMPRRRKILEGRKNHLTIGVSAEFLEKLDLLRVNNPEWKNLSDALLVKSLAKLKIDELT